MGSFRALPITPSAGDPRAGAKRAAVIAMTRCALVLLLTLTMVASACAEPTAAQAYLDRMLASNAAAVAELDRYVACAESAAALLVADPDGPGASLWLAGNNGFVLEGYNRAGGLMIAKRLKTPEDAAAGDVVLVGSLQGDDAETTALVSAVGERGALAILFAPRPAATDADFLFLDAHAEGPGESDLPTASPAIAQSLWTFTGELVTAMMRQSGRTPPLFVSVHVPNGRERNADRKGMRWDPQNAKPMPAGLVGRRYLARLANCMRMLRATQADEFAEAGRRAAGVRARGSSVWLSVLGHMLPDQPAQVPEAQMPFTALPGREPDRVPELVKPGDLVLYVGYYEPFGTWAQTVHEADAQLVTVVSGTPETPASAMGADLNICGCWPWGDVLIDLQPAELNLAMLPPSGVVQSAAFWMLLAETRQSTP